MEIIINNINYELRTEENGAYVAENNCKGEVVIPAEIQVGSLTVPVIGIGEDAFYGCDDVTGVTLPDGIKIIERSAFESMSRLREILIPDSVKYIGESAFSDCENLKKVLLPSQIKHLSADMFESCGALEEIVIPPSVKSIGDGCFAACTSLKNISLPEGLERIESRAFHLCESMEQIHIPSSVKEIGQETFYSCQSLKSIVLPEGLEYVPVDCFAMCQSLEQVAIPSSVKMVEEGAFDLTPYKMQGIHYAHNLLVSVGRVVDADGCLTIRSGISIVCDTAVSDCDNTLRKVVCPSSLRQIGRNAFANSENLTEVVLNEGLEYIDGGAFCNCKNLTAIYIPSTVKRMEGGVFAGCDRLRQIIVSPNNPYFDSRNNCNAIIDKKNNMLVSGCCITQIPNDVAIIGAEAFAGLNTLETISIPNSVREIGWNAFNSCVNLHGVVLPDHLERIRIGSFSNCDKLASLDFPDTITTVEEDALAHTAWFNNQPQGVVIVGRVLYKYKPFTDNGKEPDCVIPEGVEKISQSAFGILEHPMRVFLPKSLKHFDSMAFRTTYDYIIVPPEGVGEDYPYNG